MVRVSTPLQTEQDPELVAHERTYHAFNVLLRWSMLVLGVAILALTIWFATPGGFWGALLGGGIAFAAGYYGLIRREAKQPLDPFIH